MAYKPAIMSYLLAIMLCLHAHVYGLMWTRSIRVSSDFSVHYRTHRMVTQISRGPLDVVWKIHGAHQELLLARQCLGCFSSQFA
eukprot:1160943-Pelagomonas_calceolata.AAC.5